jgi:hypothetical protein
MLLLLCASCERCSFEVRCAAQLLLLLTPAVEALEQRHFRSVVVKANLQYSDK